MPDKNAKIYIAGHEGLVGSAVYRRLVALGYSNIITRAFTDLDLRRQTEVENFFHIERPDYVVLCAAKAGGVLEKRVYKAEFIYDNLAIAANIVHTAFKYNVKRLINLGSAGIYPKHAPQPFKEEYLLTGPMEEVNESYAIAKITAIKLCQYYNEQHNTSFISLMPTNLYGPNDNFNLEAARVLPALLRKFHLAKLLAEQNLQAAFADIKKIPIERGLEQQVQKLSDVPKILAQLGIFEDRVILWGNSNTSREFIHVDDLAAAIEFILSSSQSAIANTGFLLNVGTGIDLSLYDLAIKIKHVVNFNGDIQFDLKQPTGIFRSCLDIRKITSLGWAARIDLPSGLQQTYNEYMYNYHGEEKKTHGLDFNVD